MNNTVHPKWYSVFPDGSHRWDNGIWEDEHFDFDPEDELEEERDTLDQRLAALGF